MSREQIIKIAMVVCAVVVLCAVIIAVTGIFGSNGIGGYANAEKYTAGDTEINGGVRNLDINWTSGKVHLAYHAKDTVIVSETSSKALQENQKLRWWLDGDTLRVQYAKAGISFNWDLNKELTITLPEGTELQAARIGSTSADLDIPALKADQMILESTSGDMNVQAEADDIRIHATSGDINAILLAKKFQAETTSGDQTLQVKGKTESVRCGATSGNIEVSAEESGTMRIDSTSGTVHVTPGKTNELEVNSTSGNVTAYLAESSGFTAEIHTTSGSFNSGMALTKDGDKYTCGSGTGKIRISTTSGDVRIETVQ